MLALILTMLLTLNSVDSGNKKITAKQYLQVSIERDAGNPDVKHYRKELREYLKFRKKVNRYTRELEYLRYNRLNQLRREILTDMRYEIDQTKLKIRSFSNRSVYSGSKRNYRRNRAELYSKRSRLYARYDAEYLARELRKLEKMLREQQKLYNKINRLKYRRGYNSEEQLWLSQFYMEEFATLLKKEIQSMKKQRSTGQKHKYNRN